MPGISVSKICVPFGGGGINWSSYWKTRHPELATYTTGLTTPLSEAQIIRLGEFIEALKTGLSITNLSDAFDVMYILAGETAESSLRNLVKDAHYATAVNSPTFTAFEGFISNGTSQYLKTGYIPSVNGSAYLLNSASMGCYTRTNNASADVVEIGARTAPGNRDAFIQCFAPPANTVKATLNSGQVIHKAVTSLGFSIGTRTSVNNIKAYRNKTGTADSDLSYAVPVYEVYILALNQSNIPIVYSNRQVSFAFMGKGLSDSEVGIIVDAFEAYMDANGKGVIA